MGSDVAFILWNSKSKGTYDNYKTHFNQWIEFCEKYKIDWTIRPSQKLLVYFGAWRVKYTSNIASTIDNAITGICSTINTILPDDAIDRSQMKTLKNLMKGIYRLKGRESRPSNPIRNFELRQMVEKYSKPKYTHIFWKTVFCFAKGFGLRSGEYANKTYTPTNRTLKWSDIIFYKNNHKSYLRLKIISSKTNQNHKTEYLTRECLCTTKYRNICVVHNMKRYKKHYKAKFGLNKHDFIFRQINGKLLRQSDVSFELKRALKYIGVKNPCYPRWRPHSLRYGEITDLMAAGVDVWLVKKYARHTPNSDVTFHYTQLTAEEESTFIFNKLNAWFNSH